MVSSISIYPKLELITVMIVIPLITTCFQVRTDKTEFWVIDNLLKESNEHKHKRISILKISPTAELERRKTFNIDAVTVNSKPRSNSSSGEHFNNSKRNNIETNI